jgi:hypothetical protein
VLKAPVPWFSALEDRFDKSFLCFAFSFNLRPYTVVSGLKRSGDTVNSSAVVHMSNPNPGYVNPTDCSGMDCTGILNTAFVDGDGSLLGRADAAPTVVLPFNQPLLSTSPDCSFHGEWNAYLCPASAGWDQLAFESTDPDSYTRRVAPINMTQSNGNITASGGGRGARAYTRPPLSSTYAVSATRKHPTRPDHPLTPSQHGLHNP